MEKTNYSQLYKKLTKGLSEKTKEIFDRRFGMKTSEPETLESIGDDYGITRERVRQIEEVGFNYVKKHNSDELEKIFKNFANYFKNKGGLKREDLVLEELGGKSNKPYVLFLLTLGEQFNRVCGKRDYHYYWSTMPDAKEKVKDTLISLVAEIDKVKNPMSKKEFFATFALKLNLTNDALLSYYEVSKEIQENKDGKIGLASWPEIKPRGVKDKAYLVFKKHKKPLHFVKVAELIDELEYNQPNKKTYPQTVHNELIKDSRFVLVGRGTYALQEWGYYPGTIKDVIVKILKDKSEPLHKDEIVKQALTQRLVAKNTVLMNLNNKTYFENVGEGRYTIRKTETV